MLTNLSKWILYLASYKWVYILQIASIIFTETSGKITDISFCEFINAIASRKIVLTILLILFGASILILKAFQRLENNTRIQYELDGEIVFEIAISLIAFFVTILTISLNTYGLLLTVVVFTVMGTVIVSTDRIYVLPIFWLRRYHVFKARGAIIITKMSLEQYKLRLDANLDGIPARELVKNVYIIF